MAFRKLDENVIDRCIFLSFLGNLLQQVGTIGEIVNLGQAAIGAEAFTRLKIPFSMQ